MSDAAQTGRSRNFSDSGFKQAVRNQVVSLIVTAYPDRRIGLNYLGFPSYEGVYEEGSVENQLRGLYPHVQIVGLERDWKTYRELVEPAAKKGITLLPCDASELDWGSAVLGNRLPFHGIWFDYCRGADPAKIQSWRGMLGNRWLDGQGVWAVTLADSRRRGHNSSLLTDDPTRRNDKMDVLLHAKMLDLCRTFGYKPSPKEFRCVYSCVDNSRKAQQMATVGVLMKKATFNAYEKE